MLQLCRSLYDSSLGREDLPNKQNENTLCLTLTFVFICLFQIFAYGLQQMRAQIFQMIYQLCNTQNS